MSSLLSPNEAKQKRHKTNKYVFLFTEFMQTQTCQISELRSVVDFVELQKNKGEDTAKLDKLAKNIEFNLSKLIEEYMVRLDRDHTKRLDAFLAAR